jgi:Leucine-rich repeat (LRR) protein
LRTQLIVITVLAVPLGWVGWRLGEVRRERATITWVEEMGGRVTFQSGITWVEEMGRRVTFQSGINERSWWEESTDKWFGERVRSASLRNKQGSDLSPLAGFKSLNTLDLIKTQVSDLSPLAELKSIKQLYLQSTQVSDLSPLAELASWHVSNHYGSEAIVGRGCVDR